MCACSVRHWGLTFSYRKENAKFPNYSQKFLAHGPAMDARHNLVLDAVARELPTSAAREKLPAREAAASYRSRCISIGNSYGDEKKQIFQASGQIWLVDGFLTSILST
jgi:hypothetical protein